MIIIIGYSYLNSLNKDFMERAERLENKIISGYNIHFAHYEFKRLKRISFTRRSGERLEELRKLSIITYGRSIE